MTADRQTSTHFSLTSPVLDCVREDDVDRVNQYPLYDLGKQLRAVSAYTGNVPATAPFFDLFAASGALDNLLNGKPFPIFISRDAVLALRNNIQNIWNEYYADKRADGPYGDFR